MTEKAFNLLEEPWIRAMLPNCTIQEVSLMDALIQAQRFSHLAGELPVQDMALLRVLLAVVHTVFSRVDERGQLHPIRDEDDALERWQAIWAMKRFPEEPIRNYFETWKDRFYLFHPERPFYQVAQATAGTEFSAAKLNGEISESSNKTRLFSVRTGKTKSCLTCAEAARWLIYINGFDDTSAKPKQQGLPSPGVGWLGALGLIAAQGENLFETLMLNWVLLDDKGEPWGKNVPVWELEQPRTKERCEIPIPDNQAQLLTLQSRRLILLHDGQFVTGYKLLGGDFFSKVNAFAEQMTLWRHIPGKGSQPSYDQPRRHDPSRQIWREFSSIVTGTLNGAATETQPIPGVVRWQRWLSQNELLDAKRMARFSIASVQYGDKDFFVKDTFSDALSFHLNLLTDAGKDWNRRIETEIALADKVAVAAMYLGSDIEKASGGAGGILGEWMKTQFYARIDMPFRRFLETVDPADDYEQKMARMKAWHAEEWRVADALGKEAVSRADQTAFVGRTIVEKTKGKEEKNHYSLPEAYSKFMGQINKYLK